MFFANSVADVKLAPEGVVVEGANGKGGCFLENADCFVDLPL